MCSVCGLVRLKAIFYHNEQVQSIQIKVNLDTSKKEITRLKCDKFKPLPKFIAPSRRS